MEEQLDAFADQVSSMEKRLLALEKTMITLDELTLFRERFSIQEGAKLSSSLSLLRDHSTSLGMSISLLSSEFDQMKLLLKNCVVREQFDVLKKKVEAIPFEQFVVRSLL
ncbi:MAG: hypothetical protein H6502_03615 [Candidatus Woesearchaeota archaeon]|nr:MAG: hypothetical protein H6502_03615 [Candidatus Woesearchaeota archaeon]